jgi:hypothetical protein
LPVDPPSSEMSFPVDVPQNDLQPTVETCASDEKKISVKPRRSSNRRRASRARVR